MRCVNHPETDVQSYCQNCGKPLCASCVRTTPGGQIFCETCLAATAGGAADPNQAYWQNAANIPPLYGVPGRGPNPSAAALLGLIPGVGAMYNGQLFKGLIHVVVFAVLVSITHSYGIFGLFIGAWVLYQSFEAYHTAKARRDGLPVPDPFGLNELGNWLNLGGSGRSAGAAQGAHQPPAAANYAQPEPPPYNAPYTSSWSEPVSGAGPIPPQPPYADPYTGTNPGGYAESYPPGVVPPVPPVPPYHWRRREPIFAFVLIGLGIIFLLQSLGFVTHLMHYIWPLMLIGLGVWLIVRRVGYTQGGSK
jgi:TM2 domain-containing membrane protein YozV